jgi:hypothetical protein
MITEMHDVSGNYYDNPFSGIGFTSAYDFEKKRFIITKVGTSTNFSISFSSLTERWISFHTYFPNMYYSQNNQMFGITNGTLATDTCYLHQHNVGLYGKYYDQDIAPSSLELVFNEAAIYDKTWDNMKIHSMSRDVDGTIAQFDSWDHVRVYSDTRNTDWYDVVVTNAYGSKAVDDATTQVRARRNNNKFNLTIPRDAVVNDGVNIFEPTNLDSSSTFKPRIKGDHITAEFVYDNNLYDGQNNYEFIVNFISTTFRPNAS